MEVDATKKEDDDDDDVVIVKEYTSGEENKEKVKSESIWICHKIQQCLWMHVLQKLNAWLNLINI